jgi:hypothetical protein
MDPEHHFRSRIPRRCPNAIRRMTATPLAWAVAGLLGAAAGWGMLEPFFEDGGSLERIDLARVLLFPVTAGMSVACVLLVESASGKRLSQGLLVALGGLSVAVVCVCAVWAPSQILFKWLMPVTPSSAGFVFPSPVFPAMIARGLSWALLGAAAGAGLGLMTGRGWMAFGGVAGGFLGGLIGGFAFDPLHMFLHPTEPDSAWMSRLVSFAAMGTLIGFVPGVADASSKRSRLAVVSGGQMGSEAVINDAPCFVGSSLSCDLVLINDPEVKPVHLVIHKVGFAFWVEYLSETDTGQTEKPTARRMSLVSGSRIRVGSSEVLFSVSPRGSHDGQPA